MAKGPAMDDRLCRQNEEIVYSIRFKNSGQVASLCRDKGNKYLVYRFGKKDKVELTYPAQLNSASWKSFKFYGAKRFGGAANDAFVDYHVDFSNNGVKYQLFE